jgi:hypothetical protein
VPERLPNDKTAVPAPEAEADALFGDPISVYTRVQALSDGVAELLVA